MRTKTNPTIANKIFTQPQKLNTNLKYLRHRHLYSNYVSGNKGSLASESICFENFTAREFNLFMDSFKSVL